MLIEITLNLSHEMYYQYQPPKPSKLWSSGWEGLIIVLLIFRFVTLVVTLATSPLSCAILPIHARDFMLYLTDQNVCGGFLSLVEFLNFHISKSRLVLMKSILGLHGVFYLLYCLSCIPYSSNLRKKCTSEDVFMPMKLLP